MGSEGAADAVRLDKWLWAARFFKTRSAATEAVAGGKVEVNGDHAKPARAVRPGDMVTLRLAPFTWELAVTGTAERRGSAAQAETLYRETPASLAARTALGDQLRMAPDVSVSAGRPTKQDRRAMDRLRGRK